MHDLKLIRDNGSKAILAGELADQEEYIQEHIKGVMVSPLKGGYRKFGKTQKRGKSEMHQIPNGAMNVVYYKHKYAFILDRFSNQVDM